MDDGASVSPGDEAALADALKRQLADEGLGDARVRRAAARIRGFYASDPVAARLESIYAELLKGVDRPVGSPASLHGLSA